MVTTEGVVEFDSLDDLLGWGVFVGGYVVDFDKVALRAGVNDTEPPDGDGSRVIPVRLLVWFDETD